MSLYAIFVINLILFSTSDVDAAEVSHKLSKLVSVGRDYLFPLSQYTNEISHVIQVSNVSIECQESIKYILIGINQHQDWALKFLDASSKVEPGFYDKLWIWNIGNEEECLSIQNMKSAFSLFRIEFPENPKDGESYPSLFGNNIAYEVRKMSKTRKFGAFINGICHPSSCSSYDVDKLLNTYFNDRADITIQNQNRSLKPKKDTYQVVSIMILLSIIFMNIISTVRYNMNIKLPFAHRAFDMKYNAVAALTDLYKKEDKDDDVKDTRLMNGLKFWYLIISIVAHIPVTMSGVIAPQFHPVYNEKKYHMNSVLINMRLAVEGPIWNMVMTGSLSILSWFPFIDSVKGKFNIKTLMLVRIMRLVPIIVVCICIIIIAPLVVASSSSGLTFNPVLEKMSSNCKLNGWKELLFVGNYVHAADMCLTVGWFLSADFQLNILCFPLFMTLYRDIKKGIKVAMLYILGGIIINMIASYYSYQGYVFSSYENLDSFEFLHQNHFWTTNYIPSYVMGLILGVLIYRNINVSFDSLFNINNAIAVFIMAVILISQAVYTADINYWDYSHSKILIAVLVRAVSGLIWSTGIYLAWTSSKTNVLRRMFTSNIYDCIVRFLLPCYIAHVAVIVWLTSYTRSEALDPGSLYLQFLGKLIVVLPITMVIGFILHITVEVPFMKLAKEIFKSKK